MVDFGHDYWHAMDKPVNEQLEISSKDLGISMGIGDPWTNIKTAATAGASTIELGFTGTAKGSIQQGVTPGTLGKTKREDIRTFAKLNDIKLSTHASVGIQGITGLSRDGRQFSDTLAQNTIMEIERAIDFAADTAQGGPVVFHVGEFPRDITKYKEFRPKYGEWAKEEVASLVNTETGQIVSFQKGMVVLEPKWQKNKQGEYTDESGNIIKNMKDYYKRVPIYDETGKVKFQSKRWKDYVKETKQWNNQNPNQEMSPEKYFFIQAQRSEVDRAAPFAYSHMSHYQQLLGNVKQLEKKEKNLRIIENNMPKEKWDYLREELMHEMKMPFPKDERPSDFLKKQIEEMKINAQRQKEGFMGYAQQLEQIEKMQREIKPLEEYGVKRSAEKMAIAAMHAYEVSKKKNLKEPIFIAPENVFPEMGYGSHPKELKKLIISARNEMAQLLMQKKNITKNEAEKTAAEHIKATFDVAHANTWRKFYNKSDKEFDHWMKKEINDLIDNNIIGHAHLSDNFGYYDEHLGIGEGNTPVEMFVNSLKKKGYKGRMIVEPGAQGEGETIFSSMMGAWAKIAQSPMYRVGPVSKRWTEIEGSYFGRTYSPRGLSAGYQINPKGEDSWWSGVPIE
ncbi:MAG: TIM barrel protein [Nanoarchaeota archaeon]|nr:TIM barrel protein [Nanoarchaeota archaeon]